MWYFFLGNPLVWDAIHPLFKLRKRISFAALHFARQWGINQKIQRQNLWIFFVNAIDFFSNQVLEFLVDFVEKMPYKNP